MKPALAKLGYAIQLDGFNENKTIMKLFERLLGEYDNMLDRYRTSDYYQLSPSTHATIAKVLTEWLSYSIRPGDAIPELMERSGRLGFNIDKIHGLNITNGGTSSEEFQADILVTTEQVTLIDSVAGNLIYAYGDASGQLRDAVPLPLYQIESDKIRWFEEYQSIQL